jgi:hypothetical protein
VKAIYLFVVGADLDLRRPLRNQVRPRPSQPRPLELNRRGLRLACAATGLSTTQGGPAQSNRCRGTRGEGDERFELSVLAPIMSAGPRKRRPFWCGMGPNRWPLEATLVIPDRPDPIPASESRGRRRVALSRFGEIPRSTRAWGYLSVGGGGHLDPAQRSIDLVAGGVISRVAAPDDLAKSLRTLSERERILELARHGYWYDAVSALADGLSQSPQDAELRQWCSSLCQQGGVGPLVIGTRKQGSRARELN